MAVAVASSSTAYSGSGTSLVITKPTGLLEGELMLSGIRNDSGFGITPPSGWTQLDYIFNPFPNIYLYYKYATAGDVVASNFTWTIGSSAISAGSIIRITGASPLIGSAVLSGASNNTATPSFSTGVTPTRADSLLVIFLFSQQNANESMGGYAIATSNPTWTEIFDVVMDSQSSMSAAWAVRPQTTSTGAWSATGGTGTSDYNSFLVSINEQFAIDVNESVTLTEQYLNNISILKQESVTLTETVETEKARLWIEDTKNSSTNWTEDVK